MANLMQEPVRRVAAWVPPVRDRVVSVAKATARAGAGVADAAVAGAKGVATAAVQGESPAERRPERSGRKATPASKPAARTSRTAKKTPAKSRS